MREVPPGITAAAASWSRAVFEPLSRKRFAPAVVGARAVGAVRFPPCSGPSYRRAWAAQRALKVRLGRLPGTLDAIGPFERTRGVETSAGSPDGKAVDKPLVLLIEDDPDVAYV